MQRTVQWKDKQGSWKRLTVDLQQAVHEAVGLVQQGVVGSQRDGQVAVRLFVAHVHLHLCITAGEISSCNIPESRKEGLRVVKYLPCEQRRQRR